MNYNYDEFSLFMSEICLWTYLVPFLHLLADISPLIEVREPFRDGQEPREQKVKYNGDVLLNSKH